MTKTIDEKRRVFLQKTLYLASGATIFGGANALAASSAKNISLYNKNSASENTNPSNLTPYNFTLAKLPYAADALAPYISKETINLHYGKHHAGYVNKLNELLNVNNTENNIYAGLDLQNVIKTAAKNQSQNQSQNPSDAMIFNNAAQIYNHDFYWRSMKPPTNAQGNARSSGAIPNKLQRQIIATFGSNENFSQAFLQMAVAHFGSGWIWLVQRNDGKLDLLASANANTPITENHTPLLVMDVWEHAYYVDYKNQRAEYAKLFLQKLVNWEFATAQLSLS